MSDDEKERIARELGITGEPVSVEQFTAGMQRLADVFRHTRDALPYLVAGRTFVLEEGFTWTCSPKAPPDVRAAVDRFNWRNGAPPDLAVFNPDVETERADPVLRLVKKP